MIPHQQPTGYYGTCTTNFSVTRDINIKDFYSLNNLELLDDIVFELLEFHLITIKKSCICYCVIFKIKTYLQ